MFRRRRRRLCPAAACCLADQIVRLAPLLSGQVQRVLVHLDRRGQPGVASGLPFAVRCPGTEHHQDHPRPLRQRSNAFCRDPGRTYAIGELIAQQLLVHSLIGETWFSRSTGRPAHRKSLPPSTLMWAPVMKLLRREAQNVITAATSSGSPSRPRSTDMPCPRASTAKAATGSSGATPAEASTGRAQSVRIGPGARALTRMPSGASVRARFLVTLSSAFFAAA